MKRKIYLIIVLGLLGIVVSYILFFFIYSHISDSRLKTVIGVSKFDITTILDISRNRIIAESETYNKGEFIEYDCIIDNLYSLTVVKIGKLDNVNIFEDLVFAKEDIQSRQGWFNYDITTPYPIHDIFMQYFPLYNVFLLPLKKVEKITLFVDGKILNKEYLNNRTLSFFIRASQVSFSFNDLNKKDLSYLYAKVVNPTLSNIFFAADKDHNLYIGCASTNEGEPKTLKEIINEE